MPSMRTVSQLLEDLQALRAADVQVYRLQNVAQLASAAQSFGASCGTVQLPLVWDEYLALRIAGALQVCPPANGASTPG